MDSTNSRDRTTSTCERRIRAYDTQPDRPITTTSVGKLGPRTAMIPMASRTKGKASWASAMVMMIASRRPRLKPATRPAAEPSTPPMITAAKPTTSETRDP
jgi:hypothetical protein